MAIFWLLMMIAGGAVTSTTVNRLTYDFSLPNQPGQNTARSILATYGSSAEDNFVLVIQSTNDQPLDDTAATAAFSKVATAVPTARIISKANTNDNGIFSTQDGKVQFAYAFVAPGSGFNYEERQPLINALDANAPSGSKTTLTGLGELAAGDSSSNGPGVFAETLLGALGALAVLAFVFASFLALLPLLIAAVSILTTFLVLLGVTYLTDVSFIVEYLIALVGLGVAIDYSLLIVNRWREERSKGKENLEAVQIAVEHAGHAVVFSGITVAISLFTLVVLPVPFLRSVGLGGLLIPLISTAVATTLLPIILATVGPRIDWPRLRKESEGSHFWTRWAGGVTKRPVAAVLAAALLLLLLIIPATGLKIGNASADSLASSGPAFDALNTLRSNGVPNGAITPIEILSTPAVQHQVLDVALKTPDIATAVIETAPVKDGKALTLVVPVKETSDSSSTQAIGDLQKGLKEAGLVAGVSGIGAFQIDFQNSVYQNFPYALGLVCLFTYVLLARAFRSLILPLKAIALNITSLAATFGTLVLFWQLGYGSEAVFNINATGAITYWVPIMLFAFLFGLSMDYEVFILARVREEFDSVGNTRKAIVEGVGRTGRLVTSAALILFLAFASLSTGPETDVKVLATGLGFGILLDATVIRMLLVPALIMLFGSWNWYFPSWAARILRVENEPGQTHTPDHSKVANVSEPLG